MQRPQAVGFNREVVTVDCHIILVSRANADES